MEGQLHETHGLERFSLLHLKVKRENQHQTPRKCSMLYHTSHITSHTMQSQGNIGGKSFLTSAYIILLNKLQVFPLNYFILFNCINFRCYLSQLLFSRLNYCSNMSFFFPSTDLSQLLIIGSELRFRSFSVFHEVRL